MPNVNDYFVPGLLALSGILGNRKETTTQTNTQSSAQAPGVSAFRDNLMQQYQKMLGEADPNSGMVASNLADINHSYALRKQQLVENLAQRGITGFAADAALQQLDNQRFSDITKARQAGTFQSAQMRQNLVNQAGSFAASAPTTVTNTASTTTPGKPFAQGFSNVADFIAHQYGQQYARNNPGLPAGGNFGSSGGNFGMSSSVTPGVTTPAAGPNYVGGIKKLGSGLKKVFGFLG